MFRSKAKDRYSLSRVSDRFDQINLVFGSSLELDMLNFFLARFHTS